MSNMSTGRYKRPAAAIRESSGSAPEPGRSSGFFCVHTTLYAKYEFSRKSMYDQTNVMLGHYSSLKKLQVQLQHHPRRRVAASVRRHICHIDELMRMIHRS